MIMNKKMLAGMLLAGAATLSPVGASAQVANFGSTSKVVVIMSSKAFSEGYKTVVTQNADQYTRMDALEREINEISKPFDTNQDGQLNDGDTAWLTALQQRSVLIKSLDKNKDDNLTGTELDELRAKNLPAQLIIEKQQEVLNISKSLNIAQLYVVDAVNRQYDAALKSVVTAKKLSGVFTPDVFEWAPKEMDITAQVVAALDRLVPAVAFPVPEKFSTSSEAVNLQQQIDRILMASARAQAQQAAQQAQQGGQPGAAPAPGQPAPQPAPGEQPDSR